MRREVTKDSRCFDDSHAANVRRNRIDVLNHFRHGIDVTLGVHAARECQTDEFQISGTLAPVLPSSEHHRSYLRRTNSSLDVKNEGQRPCWISSGSSPGMRLAQVRRPTRRIHSRSMTGATVSPTSSTT